MSVRLQILVDEAEVDRLRAAAERQGLTLSEWARRAMREACERQSRGDPARKLAALRRASAHAFPVGDIEQVLEEIALGRAGGR